MIITGISGAGKLSALKTFEDLGYYAVDNLPVGLLLNFADLVRDSTEIERAALVVDIREGARLDKLPQLLQSLRSSLKTTVLFLEANEDALLRRYSETRRPHPLGRKTSVKASLLSERRRSAAGARDRRPGRGHHEVQCARVAQPADRALPERRSASRTS